MDARFEQVELRDVGGARCNRGADRKAALACLLVDGFRLPVQGDVHAACPDGQLLNIRAARQRVHQHAQVGRRVRAPYLRDRVVENMRRKGTA